MCQHLCYNKQAFGGLAQLVRASASHAEGRRFESATLHQETAHPFGCAVSLFGYVADESRGSISEVPKTQATRSVFG